MRRKLQTASKLNLGKDFYRLPLIFLPESLPTALLLQRFFLQKPASITHLSRITVKQPHRNSSFKAIESRILTQEARDISEFTFDDILPQTRQGRYPVQIMTCQRTGDVFYVKNISYLEEDSRRGTNTENLITLTPHELRLAQQKEVFSTRLIRLLTADKGNHCPTSIFPVIRRGNGTYPDEYLIASKAVPDFTPLTETEGFSVNSKQVTVVKVGDKEIETYGRMLLKMIISLFVEGDGNKQNLGIGEIDKNGRAPVVSIDHGDFLNVRFIKQGGIITHVVSKIIEMDENGVGKYVEYIVPREEFIKEKIETLVNGPMYTPFGRAMDLSDFVIAMKEPRRIDSARHIHQIFQAGKPISDLICQSFDANYPPHLRSQISDIATYLKEIGLPVIKAVDTRLQQRKAALADNETFAVKEIKQALEKHEDKGQKRG